MGFPKKISQLPSNSSVKLTDLLVSVNDNDITTKITVSQLLTTVSGSTNTYVTGGTYNDITKSINFDGNSGFPPFSVNLSGISTTDTFITGATLNGVILELDRNNGKPQITVDLSSLTGDTDTNTFVTGTTLVGTNYTINQNNGSSFTTDFNPIINGKLDITTFDTYSGDTQTEINSKLDTTDFNIYTADTQTEINSKLNITTFDTYTANTVDNNTFITGTTLVGTNYTIKENNGTSFTTDFNPIVSGFTTGSTLQEVLENGSTADLKTANIDLGSSVSNPAADGFSRLELQQNGFIQLSSENAAGDFGFIRINGQTGEAQLNQGGLKYGTDYSATFTDRSLVDKEYVDDNISNKLDITTFDTYTANTTDDVVTGATLVGSTLELERNNGLSDVTVDLSSLSGLTTTVWEEGSAGNFSVKQITDTTTDATGEYAVAQNESTIATGRSSHAEGRFTSALGDYSHAEGFSTQANGVNSHAEGSVTRANGSHSHSQNFNTFANGISSHAEGSSTIAVGEASHAQNEQTVAGGVNSHAGGFNSIASGSTSFIHSTNSLVTGDRSVVLGGQNITGSTADTVYVPFLNINNLGGGTSLNNLGIDSNGFIVVGATDENVFVNSGNANVATQQLTLTNTTGGTFNVTNAAALFSDNDINVTGGTYNNNTGCVTFRTNSGSTFDICGFVTGLTDTFVDNASLVGTTYTLSRTDGTTIPTDFNSIVSGKVDTTTFNSYSALTQMIIDSKLDKSVFNTYTANTTDNVVTGATLVGATLELERNNGLTDVTVDLSSLTGAVDTNTFVTGFTYNDNNTFTLTDNEDNSFSATINQMSGLTITNFFQDAIKSGSTYEFGKEFKINLISDSDPALEKFKAGMFTGATGPTDTNTTVYYTSDTSKMILGSTGTIQSGNTTIVGSDSIDVGATTEFNLTSSLGGVVNIGKYGLSSPFPSSTINIGNNPTNTNLNIVVNTTNITGDTSIDGFITGKTTTLFGENNTGGGTRTSLTPTLTIFDNPGTGGGSQSYAGPNLRFSDNGNIGDIFYRYNGGGNLLSNAFNFISDGGFNFIAEGDNGSPSLSDGPYFRITKGQSSLLIYDDTTRPRTDVKITNSNGGTAYSRLGVGAQNDYWYIEADDVDTPMHIGYDDNGVDTNVITFEKSDGLLEGSLEITSGLTADTITLFDTPTLNNSGTDILVRNSSSGEVEYRELSTLSASTEINTGNVLWVDSIFGDDVTAVSNRQDLPYLTIEQALTYSINGDTVIVRPGEYPEELSIPEGVSLVSEGGWEVTILGPSPASAAGAIVELNEDSFIDGFSINVPQGSFDGIIAANISGTSTANNITFYGNGGAGSTGVALNKTGGGKLIGTGIRVEGGGMETALKVDSGVLALEGVHVPQSNGDITNVLLVTTSGGVNAGRAQMLNFNCGNTNVTNAVKTTGGSTGVIPTALIYTPNIFNCTNAIKSDGDYEEINFLGGRIDSVTYVVNVDLSGTGTESKYRITSNHQPDYIYPPAVAYNAEFGLDFMQEETEIFNSSKNLFGLDQMSVGTAEIGTKSHFGRGASSTVGLKVFTTDNTASSVSDGGNFIDVTDNAKSKEGSTITFQTGGTNTTILFTTQRYSDDLITTLPYYGLNVNVLQRAVGGSYVFEYWDGSQWRKDSVHSVSEDLGYNYGNTLFLRNQSEENLTFDLSKDTWTGKTINGVEGYWMRCRTVSTGTTKPTFEQVKIIYDNTTISKEGILSLHGKSLYRESINLVQGNWGLSTTISDYRPTVGSGANAWTHEFREAEIDTSESILINMVIPAGTSTSQKVNVSANYIASGGDANDEISTVKLSFLPVEVSNNLIADIDGGKEPVQRTVSNTTPFTSDEPQIQTENSVTGTGIIHSLSFGDFDISEYYEGDMVLMRLEKESDGGDVDFNLVSLNASLSRWSLGQQSEPFRVGNKNIFSEDWSDGGVSNGWLFVTAGTNVWVVSDDTSYSGTNSLYITDDAGGSKPYQYAGSSQGGTHAYVDFSIPDNAISLTINFYWTCDGENGSGVTQWDFGSVFITDTTVTPSSGSLPASSNRIGATDNQGKFNDGYKSAEEGNWQLETIPVASNLWTAGSDVRLICSWRNDGSVQGQPPMAIDFITIDIEYNI